MRCLIVGLGSIGMRHLSNVRKILPDAEVVALRHKQTSDVNCELNSCCLVYSLDEALEYGPDFAIIASPSPFHVETAIELAQRDVHLLVEKPLSDRLDGVDELIATCQARDVTLLVGYVLRFSRPLRALQKALSQGSIGRILGFQAEVGQYLPDWRPNTSYENSVTARQELGGGALLELSHELDMACWLIGDAKSVSALTGCVSDLDIDVEDWADLNLCFSNGVVGHVHLDMVQRAPSRSCKVVGTDGSLTWEASVNRVRLFNAAGQGWTDLHSADPIDKNEMYLEELRHFLDCTGGKAVPAVTGEDGKRVLQLALAAKESAQTGKTVEL